MPVIHSQPDVTSLEVQLRARRLWYHDIELFAPSNKGLRTRFPEDYEANPVLRAVDRSNNEIEAWMSEHVHADLSGQSVLDLGCADGRFTFRAARHGAARVVGIERNRRNYEHADWLCDVLGLPNVELHWSSIDRFAPAETFDLVYCIGLIYHLTSPLVALSRIRRWCRGRLLMTSAIDLPVGDGAPIARLDRYATSAHGLWSFNVPMLRQMLSTAGFEIVQETTRGRDGAACYFALAEPGGFDEHHIFADQIDEEFPIDLCRRRQLVRTIWRELAARIEKPIALFGAGTHTPWLLEQVADIPGVTVDCVLDDRIPPQEPTTGPAVKRPSDVDVSSIGAIVVSSWHQCDTLSKRAREIFGDRVEIVRLDL